MGDIKDERGFNQIFENTIAAKIRKERRCNYMIEQMDSPIINGTTKILEIGCGTGESIKYISEKTGTDCIGIDLSSKFILSANQNYQSHNLRFIVADFNDPNTFDGAIEFGAFDYILGNGILHHLYYNLEASLENLYNLLKKGGKIIFIEPNIYNPYIATIFNIPYFRRKAFLEPDEMAFSGAFIKRKLQRTNFKNCRTEIRDFLLPNIPANLIQPVIKIGAILEKTPLRIIAQSVFITATK